MGHSSVEYDEVMKVLVACELKLRTLQEQGRDRVIDQEDLLADFHVNCPPSLAASPATAQAVLLIAEAKI